MCQIQDRLKLAVQAKCSSELLLCKVKDQSSYPWSDFQNSALLAFAWTGSSKYLLHAQSRMSTPDAHCIESRRCKPALEAFNTKPSHLNDKTPCLALPCLALPQTLREPAHAITLHFCRVSLKSNELAEDGLQAGCSTDCRPYRSTACTTPESRHLLSKCYGISSTGASMTSRCQI